MVTEQLVVARYAPRAREARHVGACGRSVARHARRDLRPPARAATSSPWRVRRARVVRHPVDPHRRARRLRRVRAKIASADSAGGAARPAKPRARAVRAVRPRVARRVANAAATSAREATPSLPKTLRRWVSTVLTDRKSSSAIAGLGAAGRDERDDLALARRSEPGERVGAPPRRRACRRGGRAGAARGARGRAACARRRRRARLGVAQLADRPGRSACGQRAAEHTARAGPRAACPRPASPRLARRRGGRARVPPGELQRGARARWPARRPAGGRLQRVGLEPLDVARPRRARRARSPCR